MLFKVSSRQGSRFLAALLSSVCFFAISARAGPFTVQLTGQATDEALFGCGAVVPCGDLLVTYSFDSTTADLNPGDPELGNYAATGITLSVNGTLLFSSASGLISIGNFGFFDQYSLVAAGTASNGSNADLSVLLMDFSATSLNSDALPTDASALAGMLPGSFTLFANDDTFQLQGVIDDVALSEVPEASSFALLSSGGLALLLARHRLRSSVHKNNPSFRR